LTKELTQEPQDEYDEYQDDDGQAHHRYFVNPTSNGIKPLRYGRHPEEGEKSEA
jgi:hypothetical protein